MFERIKVSDFVAKVCGYVNGQPGGANTCDPKRVEEFVEENINEPIASFETRSMWTDVGLVAGQHPGWSLKEAKERSQDTISFEEGARYYQMYCEPPAGDNPKKLIATQEQALMCSYFKNEIERVFPLRSSGNESFVRIPIEKDQTKLVDGDTNIFCFDECRTEEDYRSSRLTGIEMQESWVQIIGVTEVPENNIKGSMQKDMNVVEKYCFERYDKERYCAVRFEGSSSKIFTQGKDSWHAMNRLIEQANPDLAEKLENKELIEELRPVLETVTQYKGLFGKKVHKSIIGYTRRHGVDELMEPSYAVPDAWDKDASNKGRLQLIDLFGRILKWDVYSEKDVLVDYLSDEEEGLSALASVALKDLYGKHLSQAEEAWNKVDFAKYGITKEEADIAKGKFFAQIVDPEVVYSQERCKQMAEELKGKPYRDNLNAFLIFIGSGTDIDSNRYPELRSRFVWGLKKDAALSRRGLFHSEVFFQAYAPKKDQEKQLEDFKLWIPAPQSI
jgi:hypothetical protein